jgi:glycogen operon protein
VADLAYRLTGSSDLYESGGRRPSASINFVTAHDGFTLLDLVSYNEKHNEANAEENRDGTSDNLSWNCGVEGPTDDPAVTALRARMLRNFLATLFLSQGVPMLVSGDETGRTQQGNNNAYCQDNELSWVNWTLSRSARAQLEFTQRLIRLRLGHPVFHRRLFFQGRRIEGSEVKDLSWFRPDGKEMTEEEWKNGFTRCLGLRLAGDAIEEVDNAGNPIRDDTFLLLLNAHHEPIEFVLPAHRARLRWNLVLDTREWTPGTGAFRAGDAYSLEARSLALLRLRGPRDAP